MYKVIVFPFCLLWLCTITSAQYFDSSSHMVSIIRPLSSQLGPPAKDSNRHRAGIARFSPVIVHFIRLSLHTPVSHHVTLCSDLISFWYKTKQWSQKFTFTMEKLCWGLNRTLYSTISLPLSLSFPHAHKHTLLLHVLSPQGPRWYSLSLRVLVHVCGVNPVTSKEVEALLSYYQRSN